jgi:hypothetical protein
MKTLKLERRITNKTVRLYAMCETSRQLASYLSGKYKRSYTGMIKQSEIDDLIAIGFKFNVEYIDNDKRVAWSYVI